MRAPSARGHFATFHADMDYNQPHALRAESGFVGPTRRLGWKAPNLADLGGRMESLRATVLETTACNLGDEVREVGGRHRAHGAHAGWEMCEGIT